MLTALFLVWLQMSAQPQTIKYEPTLTCTCTEFENGDADGNSFTNGSSPNCGKPAKGKEYIATCWETKRAADETDGKPPITGTNNPPKGQLTKPEALEKVDVPAVQVVTPLFVDGGLTDGCKKGEILVADRKAPSGFGCSHTTCADKLRILEHDENSPPKFWCRKVQP